MILNQDVKFPKNTLISEEAKSLILAFLVKDPKYRIGTYIQNTKNQNKLYGADEIMAHPFFKDVDWEKTLKKLYIPEYKPFIENDQDCSNFDKDFTTLCK